MPSDVVTIVVSTGIGVSVVAGLLSGVCYILAHGYKTKRSRKPALQWHCSVCGRYLRSLVPEKIKVVICIECEERVCKQRCSKRNHVRKGWICYACLKRPSLVQSILSYLRLDYKGNNSTNVLVAKQRKDMEDYTDLKRKREKIYVRDFIEKLVSTILGASVDDASISRMFRDKHYDTLFDKYHQDISNAITDLSSALHISITDAPFTEEQTPCSAHANLKQLLQKVLHEASRLPNFRRAVNDTNVSGDQERTYEDLLATAILNKIISKRENDIPHSSAASTSSDANKEHILACESWETNAKLTDLDSSSLSNFDEYLLSDSSLGSTKIVDRVSLTIQQRIEEVTPTELEEYDDPDFYGTENTTSSIHRKNRSNWFLQKRQFQGTSSPVPVPMLVPNPTTNAKVLIGDKEADETSDLSDASDDIESGITTHQRIFTKLRQSNFISDEETSFDSGVREDKDDFSDREKFDNFGPKTDITVDDENVEDVSLISLHSNIEQDSEYLEKYASLPKTIIRSDSPDLNVTPSISEEIPDVKYDTLDFSHEPEKPIEITERPDREVPFFEGSYSKKEKEKWSRPISMPNNPYCEENIRKRITSNKIFGRDYYTRQASSPSGKAKIDETDTELPSEDKEIYNNHFLLGRAVPVETTDKELEEQSISELMSNSDRNSLVNYYDVENSKIYYQSPDKDQKIIEIRVNEKEPILEDDLTQPLPSKVDAGPPIKSFQNSDHKEQVVKSFQDSDHKEQVVKSFQDSDHKEQVDALTSPVLVRANSQQAPKAAKRNLPKQFSLDFPTIKQNENPTSTVPTRIVTKKSDNTLIKKIYSDPVVRTFALSNREQIPIELDNSVEVKQVNNITTERTVQPKQNIGYVSDDELSNLNQVTSKDTLSVNNFSLEYSDNGSLKEPADNDNDIEELKNKRIVAHRLGEFSKSYPDLSIVNSKSDNEECKTKNGLTKGVIKENRLEDAAEELEDVSNKVSVKDLRKLFEQKDVSYFNKDNPVHSLTARSISKQTKEKLRNSYMQHY